jgi:hypothetical protein
MTDEVQPMSGTTSAFPRPLSFTFIGGVGKSSSSNVDEVGVYRVCLANQTDTTLNADEYSSVT